MSKEEPDTFDKIIRRRYKSIDESISVLKELLALGEQELGDKIYDYALKGSALSLFQGLLDLANGLLILRDITPTSYKDLFDYLVNNKILDSSYLEVLDKIIELRNALLFGHRIVEAKEIYDFVKVNIDQIREIYHSLIKLFGEL